MTDIKDIKPDTSLYAYNSPEFYRALALIAEGKGEIECRRRISKTGSWCKAVVISDLDAYEHRLKPEPRVFFLIFRANGMLDATRDTEECARALVKAWDQEFPSSAPHAFARFVESPQ